MRLSIFYYPSITSFTIFLQAKMFGLMGLGLLEAQIVGAQVGMLMGAGMGMGMGMGMRGMGMCPPGCMNSCCRRVIICPPGCTASCCARRVICAPGCTLACCRPQQVYSNRNLCAPGCTLPCCMSQQVVTRRYQYAPPPPGATTTDPYAPNHFFMNTQPTQIQQPLNYGNNAQSDIQRQKLLQKQAALNEEKRRQEQMAQKLRLEKEDFLLKQQQQQLKQQRLQQELEQKKLAEQKATLLMNQQKIQQQKKQIIQSQMVENGYNPKFLEVGLFQGNIYEKRGLQWRVINGAQLTEQYFVNIPIQQMTKIKIKGQSQVSSTRIIKISTYSGDTFFSIFENQQIELGAKIIWAKVTSMGKSCRINQPFNGHVEGEIVKKGFFSGWQPKYANVSGDALRISNQLGSPAHTIITRISQLWTRFEFIRGNLLVLKMHHNGTKLQIGVPIQNAMAWIRGISNLIQTT